MADPSDLQRLSQNDPTLTSLSIFSTPLPSSTTSTSSSKSTQSTASSQSSDLLSSTALANALSSNTHLEKLWLNDNGMDDAALAPILKAIGGGESGRSDGGGRSGGSSRSGRKGRGHPRLKQLYITKNAVGDEGCRLLAEIMTHEGGSGESGRSKGLQLQELWLNSNQISDAGLAHLSHALSSPFGNHLLDLRLNSNHIGDAGVSHLAHALDPFSSGETPRLTTIHLRSNHIGVEGGRVLAKKLRSNERVTTVALQGNEGLNDVEGKEILERIAKICKRNEHKRLKEEEMEEEQRRIQQMNAASMHNVKEGKEGKSPPYTKRSSSISEGMDEHHATVAAAATARNTRVSISNRDMNAEETIEYLEEFVEVQIRLTKAGKRASQCPLNVLEEIKLFNEPLTVPIITRLAQVLPRYWAQLPQLPSTPNTPHTHTTSNTSNTLTTLWLNDNSIGDAGLPPLCIAIAQTPSLTKVYLTKNNIGDFGTLQLSHVLKEPTCHIQELNLSNNSIGDEGASALADALKHNSTLVELRLNQNKIGNVGAGKLGYALSMGHGSLKLLSLKGNRVGDVGGYSFVASLGARRTMSGRMGGSGGGGTGGGSGSGSGSGSGRNWGGLKVLMDGNDISESLREQLKMLSMG